MADVKSVLFVCWGNVCRSLAAEVILKREMKRLGVDGSQIDSAGISPDDQPSKPSWPMRWASFQRGVWLKPKQRLLRKKDLDREFALAQAEYCARHGVNLDKFRGMRIQDQFKVVIKSFYDFYGEEM